MRQLEYGLSERTLAFEPGFEVHGQVVSRTFQPSYVVKRNGVLINFCQGRLLGGRDLRPKGDSDEQKQGLGHDVVANEGGFGTDQPTTQCLRIFPNEMDASACPFCLWLICEVRRIFTTRTMARCGRSPVSISMPWGAIRLWIFAGLIRMTIGDTWTMETLLGDRSPLNHRYSDGTLIMFNAVGQVHAITQGRYRGRYILGGPVTLVPEGESVTIYFRNHPQSGSAVIHSHDQGETWRVDGFITDYLANDSFRCVGEPR